jgi:hypothetical protein
MKIKRTIHLRTFPNILSLMPHMIKVIIKNPRSQLTPQEVEVIKQTYSNQRSLNSLSKKEVIIIKFSLFERLIDIILRKHIVSNFFAVCILLGGGIGGLFCMGALYVV